MTEGSRKPDTRAHPRVDLFTKVKIIDKESQQTQELISGNVSQGGIFLRCNRPLPKGKKVSLEFELEQGPVKIEEAEVVWAKPFEPISIDGSLPGMGLRFSKVHQEAIERIGQFIKEALEEKEEDLPLEKQPTDPEIKTVDSQPPPSTQPAQESQPPTPAPIEEKPVIAEPKPAYMKLELKTTKPTSPAPQPMYPEFPQPPSVQKRLGLFLLFVLIAATVTFFILWVTVPIEKNQPSSIAAATIPQVASTPTEPSKPQIQIAQAPQVTPQKNQTSEEATPAQPPAPAAEAQPQANTKTVEQTPKPAPSAIEKPASLPEPALAKPKDQPPVQSAQPQVASNSSNQLGQPVFRQTDRGWQMELFFSQAKKVDHFPLKNPPRLAIDFYGLSYSGKQKVIENPTPLIQRLRVGVDPEKTRVVIDFAGEKVPAYKVSRTSTGLVVNFY